MRRQTPKLRKAVLLRKGMESFQMIGSPVLFGLALPLFRFNSKKDAVLLLSLSLLMLRRNLSIQKRICFQLDSVEVLSKVASSLPRIEEFYL